MYSKNRHNMSHPCSATFALDAKKDQSFGLEIELCDEQGNPVPNEPYKVVLEDGTNLEGKLDDNGFKRIENLEKGSCRIIFPQRDKTWWEPIEDNELFPSELKLQM